MGEMTRSAVMARLRVLVEQRVPIVGSGAGTGISGKCAEAGGAEVNQVFADIDASLASGTTQVSPYAAGEIHNPTSDNSILPPAEPAAEIVEKPKRAPRKKAVVAEPAAVEPAKAPRKRAVAEKDITVDAPKAARAPRKRTAKAGGSTASDIVS